MSLSAARECFAPDPDLIYLDAGTYGLPPRPAIEALQRALRDWQTGAAVYDRDWEPAGERCRALFARLIGAPAEEIALVPSVSAGVGIVAASLPAGAEVLVPGSRNSRRSRSRSSPPRRGGSRCGRRPTPSWRRRSAPRRRWWRSA